MGILDEATRRQEDEERRRAEYEAQELARADGLRARFVEIVTEFLEAMHARDNPGVTDRGTRRKRDIGWGIRYYKEDHPTPDRLLWLTPDGIVSMGATQEHYTDMSTQHFRGHYTEAEVIDSMVRLLRQAK
jgi:hypothetical protein